MIWFELSAGSLSFQIEDCRNDSSSFAFSCSPETATALSNQNPVGFFAVHSFTNEMRSQAFPNGIGCSLWEYFPGCLRQLPDGSFVIRKPLIVRLTEYHTWLGHALRRMWVAAFQDNDKRRAALRSLGWK